MWKVVIIVLLAIFTPLGLSLMMDSSWVSTSPGTANGWLGYWGGYLGAIIGASVVYFVSRFQIKAQHETQLTAIEREHQITLDREMHQYYFKLENEKLEDLYKNIDSFNLIITNVYNDFVYYITLSESLYSGRDNLELSKQEEYEQKIRNIRTELTVREKEIYRALLVLRRLSFYIEGSQDYISCIGRECDRFLNELRNTYNYKYSYESYLAKPDAGNNRNLIGPVDEINRYIIELTVDVLQPLMEKKIQIMRSTKTNISR
ncbi:hypothetical protein [Jeotgalibacillus campisalis]|uniref:Uncharacterized protein n=1 Tax=Jeotgalibacillus campisalis TaxID=220754 RepID=A0A0C2VB61_9BACL|nr:hypothetical protein [Jeotgalibacillus campisalis]KIL46172.1 hypothetical protein KR50_28470 [Jeotgalibacillus campisalis]